MQRMDFMFMYIFGNFYVTKLRKIYLKVSNEKDGKF